MLEIVAEYLYGAGFGEVDVDEARGDDGLEGGGALLESGVGIDSGFGGFAGVFADDVRESVDFCGAGSGGGLVGGYMTVLGSVRARRSEGR